VTAGPYDANRDPDQIRREIERTQTTLSRDVDTLAEKVSPGQIVQRRADRARGKLRGWKDAVMGSAQDTLPRHSASSPGSGPLSATADAASDVASRAADTASDVASRAADTAQEMPHAIRRQTQGNPLAAGLIAFGIGWLASSLLPATRREQELVQQAGQQAAELGQPVAEAAKQAAAQMKDNLAEPAQQAVESVRSTATDAGRTVAEEGRSAAGDVQGEAQQGAGRVRDASGR
jgi:cell division septum initiation protein DivIVA